MEREFAMLKFERNGDADYTLFGLPEGKKFKDSDNYEEIDASTLFVNGVGFSAPAGEFSQHERTVTVRQETDGGQARIEIAPETVTCGYCETVLERDEIRDTPDGSECPVCGNMGFGA